MLAILGLLVSHVSFYTFYCFHYTQDYLFWAPDKELIWRYGNMQPRSAITKEFNES